MIESANFTMIHFENYSISDIRVFITSYEGCVSYIVYFLFLPEISLFSCIFIILSYITIFTFIKEKIIDIYTFNI